MQNSHGGKRTPGASALMQTLFLLAVAVCMAAGLVRTFLFPKEINYYENRKAEKVGRLTARTFTDSEFQDSVESALADQIPAAQSLKKLYNDINSRLIENAVVKESGRHPEAYFNYGGVYIHDGYIIWQPFDVEESRHEFEETAESFNAAARNNPGTGFYLYYIENDSGFDFRTGEKTPLYEYVKSLLSFDEGHVARFELKDFDQYKREFYKTDHHWNYRGAYRGYREILKLLGAAGRPMEPVEEIELPYSFAGSKSNDSGLTGMKELPTVYRFEYPPLGAMYGGEDEIISGRVKDFSYEMFYGVNLGEYEFCTGDESRESILIIGDSFDNAVLKLVASHFNRTYSIDMRNLELPEGGCFNISRYINEKGIDKVLIVASQVVFTSGEYILES